MICGNYGVVSVNSLVVCFYEVRAIANPIHIDKEYNKTLIIVGGVISVIINILRMCDFFIKKN